tara:strand:+ start:728 stop:1048 length:321 start_codon:yes stop_codon:yes gene_type:complete
MKLYFLTLVFTLISCVNGENFTSSITEGESFFLCFPSMHSTYPKLSFEEKLEIEKEISLEKSKRKLNCEIFSDLISAENNLKRINQEEMERKIRTCRYRGEPCTYD